MVEPQELLGLMLITIGFANMYLNHLRLNQKSPKKIRKAMTK
jgi:hypothetical protein